MTWAFDLTSGTLEFGADAYTNGGAYFTAQNRESSREDAYTVVNARISYLHAASKLRVTLFGRNLNDARYHYNLSDFDFGSPTTLAPPATYGVRLNWDF